MPKTAPSPDTAARRRARRPSPSNEAFLERAFELFSERGYEGTTINVITDSIGVTKRTVYAKYGDKDAVFLAALRHTISTWIIPTEALQACESADLQATLEAIAFRLLDNLLSPRGLQLLQMTTALSLKAPELGAHNVHHGIKPTLDYLADLFQRRIGDDLGTFQSRDGAAMAFLNVTVGGLVSLIGWGVLLEKAAIDNYISACVAMFLKGLAGTAEGPGAALHAENIRLKMLVADLVMAEKFR